MADGIRAETALWGPYPLRDARFSPAAGAACNRGKARAAPASGFDAAVAGAAERARALSTSELATELEAVRERLHLRGLAADAIPRAFAAVGETAGRTLGLRPYPVQYRAAAIILYGMLVEMDTGEGKTLTAGIAAATVALAGIPVHVITGNDYLAARDAELMTPLYTALGLTVGTAVAGMDDDVRRAAYRCAVAYCSNKQIPFDYLRDQLAFGACASPLSLRVRRLEKNAPEPLLRGLHFAIVDEADHVLIDEARVPLIIARDLPIEPERAQEYRIALDLSRRLKPEDDYLFRRRNAQLTPQGRGKLAAFAEQLPQAWRNARFREFLTLQAIVADQLYRRDHHYLVRDGKIEILDPQTGRAMPDRSWEQGLHQLIECKEDCAVTGGRETLARTTYQRFFRRYLHLAGMSGTAREVRREFHSVYGLKVVRVEPHRPSRRVLLPVRVFPRLQQKWAAVIDRIVAVQQDGRPVLVGTSTVADADYLSALLTRRGLPHRVLSARQDREEAAIIAAAGEPGAITVATQMAGRGTDIRLGSGVADRGGLHVILTERNEAARIDRQLIGRCARQGDPGSAEAVLSMEDRLAGTVFPPVIQGFLVKICDRLGEFSSLTRITTRLPQRISELRHAADRKRLQKQDEQLAKALAFAGKQE